jgi:hypothetical protein
MKQCTTSNTYSSTVTLLYHQLDSIWERVILFTRGGYVLLILTIEVNIIFDIITTWTSTVRTASHFITAAIDIQHKPTDDKKDATASAALVLLFLSPYRSHP